MDQDSKMQENLMNAIIDKVQASNDLRLKEEIAQVKLVYEKQYADLKSLYDRDQLELEKLREKVAKQPSLEQLLNQIQNDPMSMMKKEIIQNIQSHS